MEGSLGVVYGLTLSPGEVIGCNLSFIEVDGSLLGPVRVGLVYLDLLLSLVLLVK